MHEFPTDKTAIHKTRCQGSSSAYIAPTTGAQAYPDSEDD